MRRMWRFFFKPMEAMVSVLYQIFTNKINYFGRMVLVAVENRVEGMQTQDLIQGQEALIVGTAD